MKYQWGPQSRFKHTRAISFDGISCAFGNLYIFIRWVIRFPWDTSFLPNDSFLYNCLKIIQDLLLYLWLGWRFFKAWEGSEDFGSSKKASVEIFLEWTASKKEVKVEDILNLLVKFSIKCQAGKHSSTTINKNKTHPPFLTLAKASTNQNAHTLMKITHCEGLRICPSPGSMIRCLAAAMILTFLDFGDLIQVVGANTIPIIR